MFTDKEIKSFNEIEMEMYHFTMQNKNLVPYMTIREFAAVVHSSPPSVLRFCRKVGYSGFMEFKKCCKQDLEQSTTMDQEKDSGILLEEFLTRIDTAAYQEKLQCAAVMLAEAERIFCAGNGASGSIAYYAASYFTACGKFANFVDGRFLKSVHRLTADLYILFSVSGESENMINFIQRINENKGKSLVITNSNFSTLAKFADFVLPYNIYYMKDSYKSTTSINEIDKFEHRVDDLSTQLPVVYLIETLAKMIFVSGN